VYIVKVRVGARPWGYLRSEWATSLHQRDARRHATRGAAQRAAESWVSGAMAMVEWRVVRLVRRAE
jgi:hypothetical protein